jgi:hypothetical protein
VGGVGVRAYHRSGDSRREDGCVLSSFERGNTNNTAAEDMQSRGHAESGCGTCGSQASHVHCFYSIYCSGSHNLD